MKLRAPQAPRMQAQPLGPSMEGFPLRPAAVVLLNSCSFSSHHGSRESPSEEHNSDDSYEN